MRLSGTLPLNMWLRGSVRRGVETSKQTESSDSEMIAKLQILCGLPFTVTLSNQTGTAQVAWQLSNQWHTS